MARARTVSRWVDSGTPQATTHIPPDSVRPIVPSSCFVLCRDVVGVMNESRARTRTPANSVSVPCSLFRCFTSYAGAGLRRYRHVRVERHDPRSPSFGVREQDFQSEHLLRGQVSR